MIAKHRLSRIAFSVKVMDFLDQPAVLRSYLQTTLNFNDKIVDALLNSYISTESILNISSALDIGGLLCNETRLRALLEFNSSDSDVAALSKQLCKFDNTKLIENVTETLLRHANLANYIASFVKIGFDNLFSSHNISTKEISSTIETVAKSEKELNTVVTYLDEFSQATSKPISRTNYATEIECKKCLFCFAPV